MHGTDLAPFKGSTLTPDAAPIRAPHRPCLAAPLWLCLVPKKLTDFRVRSCATRCRARSLAVARSHSAGAGALGSGGVSCAEGPAHSLLVRSRRWPQPLANGLEHDVKRRDRENPDERCQYHAAEHRRADVEARQLRGAGGDGQRKKAKDEGERRHHHGPEAQPRTSVAASSSGTPFPVFPSLTRRSG